MPTAQQFIRSLSLVTLFIASTAVHNVEAQQINTGAPGGTGSTTYGFGYCGIIPAACGAGAYLSVGQTFTAPTGVTQLDQFQFFMTPYHLPSAPVDLVNWQWFIAAFDQPTHTISGPLIYQSGLLGSLPYANNVYSWQTFTTPVVAVTPGSQYILFLSAPYYFANQIVNGTVPQIEVMTTNADYYTGGEAVSVGKNGPSTLNGLLTSAWLPEAVPGDFAFTATFSTTATPEPSTIALLASGMVGLVGTLTTRKRRVL